MPRPAAAVSVSRAQQLAADGAVLLDVREDDEWAAGHAPEAMHVPMSRIGAEVTRLPNERLLVCVCHVGARSAAVAAALLNAGFDAVNMTGGMAAWESAGLPVVRD